MQTKKFIQTHESPIREYAPVFHVEFGAPATIETGVMATRLRLVCVTMLHVSKTRRYQGRGVYVHNL